MFMMTPKKIYFCATIGWNGMLVRNTYVHVVNLIANQNIDIEIASHTLCSNRKIATYIT